MALLFDNAGIFRQDIMCLVKSLDPLITLIIPVYNVEPYLLQCLNSVVRQSYRNLEIIIVDDGSTDGSRFICDDFAAKDDRITVFHTENMGLSAARNCGLDHMSKESQFVVFLDSDDWIELNAVHLLYNTADKYSADIVTCPYYFEINEKRKKKAYSVNNRKVLEGQNQILEHYITVGDIGRIAWNKMYRSELFTHIRYPIGRAFEDIFTTYKLVLNSRRIIVIPDILFHYRLRENSLSRDYSMKCLIDYWEANFEQYTVLIKKITDLLFRQSLVKCCLSSINRMWRGYGGCTKEEKQIGERTIRDMMNFASEHRRSIIYESGYTMSHKLICVLATSNNSFLMWLENKLYCLVRIIRRGKRFA